MLIRSSLSDRRAIYIWEEAACRLMTVCHGIVEPFPRTPLCRLCGRLDDLISEPTRAVGATVTEGTVILIGLPRMAR